LTALDGGGEDEPRRVLDSLLDQFEDWPGDATLRITVTVSRPLPEARA